MATQGFSDRLYREYWAHTPLPVVFGLNCRLYRVMGLCLRDSHYANSPDAYPKIAHLLSGRLAIRCAAAFLFGQERALRIQGTPKMRVSGAIQCLAIAAFMATFCCTGAAQQPADNGTISVNSIIEALERAQAAVHPEISYQIVREYRLFGARDSEADSEVVAEVNFKPQSGEDYRIQRSSGSSRGQQVVQRVLKHETERVSHSNQAQIALTRDNYDFRYVGEEMFDEVRCYVLELSPRRREPDLISGRVWIDEHSFLARHIEGELAKSPSWWLKKVRVNLTFANLAGAWLQTGMEAVADVRIVGTHTLTSRVLDYRTTTEVAIDGHFARSARRSQW